MQLIFYNSFERCGRKWDWRTPATEGVGGSETHQIEMARRLAARGHQVVSYSPTGEPSQWEGVDWRPARDADFAQPGLWIFLRRLPPPGSLRPREDQVSWLVAQDVNFNSEPEQFEETRIQRLIALSRGHQNHLRQKYPTVAERVCLSSNGLCGDEVDHVLSHRTEARQSMKVIYATSFDRGLLPSLEMFSLAYQVCTDLEFHVFFDREWVARLVSNFREGSEDRRLVQQYLDAMDRYREHPRVVWHDRCSHSTLLQAFSTSGVWLYPSLIYETSCITAMEA